MIRRRGFTLVELMTTVAIVAILVLVAMFLYDRYQTKAMGTEAKVALSAIYKAESTFAAEYNTYTGCLSSTTYGSNISDPLKHYASGFGGTPQILATGTNSPPCRPGEGISYFTLGLNGYKNHKTYPSDLENTVAGQTRFVAAAAMRVSDSEVDLWTIDEQRNLRNILLKKSTSTSASGGFSSGGSGGIGSSGSGGTGTGGGTGSIGIGGGGSGSTGTSGGTGPSGSTGSGGSGTGGAGTGGTGTGGGTGSIGIGGGGSGSGGGTGGIGGSGGSTGGTGSAQPLPTTTQPSPTTTLKPTPTTQPLPARRPNTPEENISVCKTNQNCAINCMGRDCPYKCTSYTYNPRYTCLKSEPVCVYTKFPTPDCLNWALPPTVINPIIDKQREDKRRADEEAERRRQEAIRLAEQQKQTCLNGGGSWNGYRCTYPTCSNGYWDTVSRSCKYFAQSAPSAPACGGSSFYYNGRCMNMEEYCRLKCSAVRKTYKFCDRGNTFCTNCGCTCKATDGTSC